MLTPEWLAILHELENPDELEQIFAALYLYHHLPMRDLVYCTLEQIEKIAGAAPVTHG